MKKIEIYYQNSQEYNNIINNFIRKFEIYFKGIISKEDIKNMFLNNLKKIKFINGVESFKQFPFFGYVSGVYFLSKTLKIAKKDDIYDESVVFHELFHALSRKARMKRVTLKRTFLSMFTGKKYISMRDLEEGMTEYLASCMLGEEYKNIFFIYAQQTAIIYKLAKIYGDNLILEYYLGINNKLVEELNRDYPNGFKKIIKLCGLVGANSQIPLPFETIRYYKNKKLISDDFLFNLFKSKKIIEVKTLFDFKNNIKQIISFYEADLYNVCYTILNQKKNLKEAQYKKDNDMEIIYQGIIKQYASSIIKLFDILKIEWQKLNIVDDKLFYDLVFDEIKHLNEKFSIVVDDFYQYINNNTKRKVIKTNDRKKLKEELIELKKYLKYDINQNNQNVNEIDKIKK